MNYEAHREGAITEIWDLDEGVRTKVYVQQGEGLLSDTWRVYYKETLITIRETREEAEKAALMLAAFIDGCIG